MYRNSYESVNKCTKLYETVRFIKTYGNIRFHTFSYVFLCFRTFSYVFIRFNS